MGNRLKKGRMQGKTLKGKMKNLLIGTIVPFAILLLMSLVMFTSFSVRFSHSSGNITMASAFNRNFKDDIDLKMYYYAVDSEYATGIPYEEIETALTLAKDLEANTANRDSLKAVHSVINLCEKLRDRIEQIRVTDEYDERIKQLEFNVYVTTEMIQNYMYTYLYYEAGELARIQNSMTLWLNIEIIGMSIALIVIITITIAKSVNISRSITQPIDGLYARVQSIGEGDLTVRQPVATDDMQLMALSNGFEEMVDRLKTQMELNTAEAERIRSMELMLLQAQINPHFLYNTLDTIIWLIETGKNGQAVEMVASLSNFFRTSLSKGRDVITLGEEELHVKSYLEIQQVRYKDILNYGVSIDPELKEMTIPKLTLQPIVENALYHGIKLKRGMGCITIVGKKENDHICLEVNDTGIGMSAEELERVRSELMAELASGFGMSAVYKRLKLMFKDECSFDIESEQGVGTTVRILIPARPLAQ